jgi:cadmium resistance protein CadD (predicted permease)
LTDLITIFGIGIAAFVASNIDDTFILILLFVTPGLLARNVIVGQFLGIVILVIISSFAALITLAVPTFVLGFMGIIPVVIGIKRLLKSRETPETEIQSRKRVNLSSLSVTAITVSNGGDDIGVFTPLLANYNGIGEYSLLISLLMVMTGIWCIVTYYFIRHPFIATRVNLLSQVVSPLALISIGVYVILDSVYYLVIPAAGVLHSSL